MKFKLFITVFIFCCFGKSAAQKTDNDSVRHKSIDEVTVLGLKAISLSLPHVEMSSVKIENLHPLTPADALQHTTGIALSRDGVWATSLNIRGLSEQRLLILTDNDRLLSATDVAATLSAVDVNSLEKIEVIKGAASVLYGSGAMGGVVNFVTKRPGFTETQQATGKISSGYHSVNNLWENNANVQITGSDWYLGLTGSYRNAGNIMTPDGKLPNSQFNDASWGIKGGLKYRDSQQMHVSYNHFGAWDVGLPGGSAFPATAVVKYKGVVRNQLNGEYTFADLTDNIKLLSIKAYTQNISRDVENQVNATTRILPSSMNRTSGIKALADVYFNDYNTLKIGAETWTRKAQTIRLKMVYPSDTTITGEQPTPNANVLDAGVFAQYKWIVSPKYVTINTGLRVDFIQTSNDTAYREIYKYKIKNGIRTELAHSKAVLFNPGVSNEFSYAAHADVEYTPSERNLFVLSLGNSYRVASIEERFKYIDQAGTLRVGNPDLKPEKGIFSNLNYTLKGNRLLIKADVFANYLFDLIAEKAGTYYNGTTQVAALVNTNISRALFTGVETELSWIISKQFSLNSNFSFINARDLNNNSFIPQIPPARGEIALNYRQDKIFDLTLMAVAAAAQNSVAQGEPTTDGYIIFNCNAVSAPVKFGKSSVVLFAGIDNILNTAYYNHLSTTRGINRLEPGRNIFAKIKLDW